MSINVPRFWEQVRLREDSGLELKEAQFRGHRVSAPRRDDLADELAAVANSRGGRFVLGVSSWVFRLSGSRSRLSRRDWTPW